MKHVKLFEAWMDDSQAIDLSKFAGDVSSEEEGVFIHQQEDSYFAVLADKETCWQLQKLGEELSLLDEDIYKTWNFNTPGTAFAVIGVNEWNIGIDGISMKVKPGDNVIVYDLNGDYEVVSGDDSGEMNQYVFPLKRGAATHLYQGSDLNVISVQDLMDIMKEAIEAENL